MTLRIDRLNLRLPAGFEQRASFIVDELGELLAGMDLAGDHRSIDLLNVPALQVAPTASDREVARAIASGIEAGLQRSTTARRT